MERESIIKSIEIAILEVEKHIKKYNLTTKYQLRTHTIMVLDLLKKEFESDKTVINKRLLRGYKDICTTTAINMRNQILMMQYL